jgi:hypothetical protein
MFLNRAILVAVLAGAILLTGAWMIGGALSEGVPVSRFPELPKAVAGDLIRRGCTIVHDRARRDGRNVLRGEFARAGQTDWAVLCRQGSHASLLVYWAGNPDNPEVLNTSSSGLGKDPEAARSIRTVDVTEIRQRGTRYTETRHSASEDRKFDHEGIEDAVGMGSTILYYANGQWLGIPGAD